MFTTMEGMREFDSSKVLVSTSVNISKLTHTNILPGIIIITNYTEGRNASCVHLHKATTGVPEGGVLSPTLLGTYASDILAQLEHVYNS